MDRFAERARYVTPAEARAAATDLASRGWRVVQLPDGIVDRQGFFDALRAEIRLDPPMESLSNWDAFDDSLGSGIWEMGPTPLAIVWADPEPMRATSPTDFVSALGSLGVQTYEASRAPTVPTEIRVIVGGPHPMGPDRES